MGQINWNDGEPSIDKQADDEAKKLGLMHIGQKLNEVATSSHETHQAMVDAFAATLIKSGFKPTDFEVVTQWLPEGLRTFIRPKTDEVRPLPKIVEWAMSPDESRDVSHPGPDGEPV